MALVKLFRSLLVLTSEDAEAPSVLTNIVKLDCFRASGADGVHEQPLLHAVLQSPHSKKVS
jgi:hypothetical protein